MPEILCQAKDETDNLHDYLTKIFLREIEFDWQSFDFAKIQGCSLGIVKVKDAKWREVQDIWSGLVERLTSMILREQPTIG